MAVWLEDTADFGQVRVETGTGLITELKHEAGRRNAQVIIRATHQDLRDPVTGWADTADSGVWPVAQDAHTNRYEIEYRIEVKRKGTVDKDTPIAELGNREKVRDIAALARKGELSQLDATPPPAATPPPTDQPDPEPPPPPAEQPPTRRPRVEEAKAWQLYNSDGSLNLGSWSYQGTVEMVELAHDLTVDATGAAELSLGKVQTLAKNLLDIADQVQAATRADGHVDRMDSSHRRARYAVRTGLQVHPVPWGADADTRKAWADRLTSHATGILHISLTLFRFHETGEHR